MKYSLQKDKHPYPKVYLGQRINWRGEILHPSSIHSTIDFGLWEPIAVEEFGECKEFRLSCTIYSCAFHLYVTCHLATIIYQIL